MYLPIGRPSCFLPATAVSNTGSNVVAQIRNLDGGGFKAYSGDYIDVDFGNADVSKGARVVLRVRGFNQGTGEDKPFIGPPAVVVQVRDGNDAWQEIGRLSPRFDWSEGAFDLSSYLPDRNGKRQIRLASISHGVMYHEIDFVALATGPQPPVTVTDLPLISATFGSTDVSGLLSTSDNRYVQMGSGNKFAVSFTQLPQETGLVRDFIVVSEGYYIPKGNTFFIYTWDGTQWLQRDSYSFTTTDSVRTFDLSSVLPDPDGEYKVRIWQDYANWPAAIDYVGLKVGSVAGTLQSATDLRDGTSILPLVRSSDDIRLVVPAGQYLASTPHPLDRVPLERPSVGITAAKKGAVSFDGSLFSFSVRRPGHSMSPRGWTGLGGIRCEGAEESVLLVIRSRCKEQGIKRPCRCAIAEPNPHRPSMVTGLPLAPLNRPAKLPFF